MESRYFIFDTFGAIIGNPAGYRTMRGARAQCENRNSKVRAELWRRVDVSEKLSPTEKNHLIYSIKLID